MQQAGSHINSRHIDLYAWRYTYRTKVSKGVAATQTPDPSFLQLHHISGHWHCHKKTVQRSATSTISTLTVPYRVSIHVAGASMLVAGFSYL